MLSQEMINSVNALPIDDQRKIFDYVELVIFHRKNKDSENNRQNKEKMAKLYPSKSVENPIEETKYRYGKEAVFGLFTSDFDITDEEMEQAIAEGASEGIEQSILPPVNANIADDISDDGFYAYVDAPKQQESIEDSFGIIKTNRKVSLEDMQQAIETMGGTLDNC